MARPTWKRKLLITAVSVVAVLVLAWVALLVFVDTDSLKDTALARARDATGYSIEAGPASLHLGFSGVGVRIEDLDVAAPDRSQLLQADAVDVYVKIFPLLRKELALRSVVIHRPRLVSNPSLAKTPEGGSGGSGGGSPALSLLAVDSWKIQDGSYLQEDPERPLAISGLDLGGNVSWSPAGGAKGHVGGSVAQARFGPDEESTEIGPLDVEVDFEIEASQDRARLTGLEVRRGPVQLAGELSLNGSPAGWGGEGVLRIAPVTWADLEEVLPPAGRSRLQDMTITGRFAVPELRVQFGPDLPQPRLEGKLTFEDVGVRSEGAPTGLSGLSGEVDVTPEGLSLPRASGRLGDESLVLSAQLTGFPPERGTAHVTTRVPAPVLAAFTPESAPVRLTGGAVDIDLGATADLPPQGLPALDGSVQLDGLRGSFRSLPLENVSGQLRFDGATGKVQKLHAEIGTSDVTLNGTLADLSDPWLRFDLESNHLDLDELFPPVEGGGPAGGPAGGEETPAVGVPGEGTIHVGELITRGWHLQAVKARARLTPEGVDLTGITARLYGGTAQGDLHLQPQGDAWKYTGQVRAEDVKVGELLAQRFSLAKSLAGALRFDADLDGRTGEAGLDAWRALSMTGEAAIQDGAILNQPRLESVARMLGLEGASRDRWPFRSLLTDFKVEHGNIVIEPLRMQQPGANWIMQGTVGPDGGLALGGTLTVDPARAKLPPEVQAVSKYLVNSEGKIPIPFQVGGKLSAPDVELDWAGLATRARKGATSQQEDALQQKLQDAVPDSTPLGNTIKRLFKGGGKQD